MTKDPTDLTIRQSAERVARDLGYGHREAPYTRALCFALEDAGATGVQQEYQIPILMKSRNDTQVGVCYADIVCLLNESLCVIEIKRLWSSCNTTCRKRDGLQVKKYKDLLKADKAFVVTFALEEVQVSLVE